MTDINLPAKTFVAGSSAVPLGPSVLNPWYTSSKTLSDERDSGVIGKLIGSGALKYKTLTATSPAAQASSVTVAHDLNPDNILFVFLRATMDISQHFYLFSDNVGSLYGDGNRLSCYVVGNNISIQTSQENSGSVLSKALRLTVFYFE